jgi:hypothetical protein
MANKTARIDLPEIRPQSCLPRRSCLELAHLALNQDAARGQEIRAWPVSQVVSACAGVNAAIVLAALAAAKPNPEDQLCGLTQCELVRCTWISRPEIRMSLHKLLSMRLIAPRKVDRRRGKEFIYMVDAWKPEGSEIRLLWSSHQAQQVQPAPPAAKET